MRISPLHRDLNRFCRYFLGDPTGRKGFSLIELMIVLAIIGILAGLVVPAMRSTSGKMTQAEATLTGMLDEGRMQAVSKNTYVWFCLREDLTSSSPGIEAVLVSSLNASAEEAPWGNTTPLDVNSSSVLRIESRVEKFESVSLLLGDELAELLEKVHAPLGEPLSDSGPIFLIKRSGKEVEFPWILRFSPSGAARSGEKVSRVYQFGVVSTADSQRKNPLLFSIESQTGKARVYRR